MERKGKNEETKAGANGEPLEKQADEEKRRHTQKWAGTNEKKGLMPILTILYQNKLYH